MRRFKKYLSVILVITMIITMIPTKTTIVNAASYENTHKNTGNNRTDIIGVAKTQIGYREGSNNSTKYGTWYGMSNQPWCAMFVSWCARQAGVSTTVLKNSAVASPGSSYFNIKYYDGSSYTPKSGDLFFTKSFSHVGLVYYIDGNYFYTIEGNSNNSGSSEGIGVFSLKRKISDYYFGVPNYNDKHIHSYDNTGFEAAHPHRVYKRCSCGEAVYVEGKTVAYQNCSTCMKLSWAYVQPVKAYTINTGKTIVYDRIEGTAKTNKIYDTDLCTIDAIYDCGWCHVTFPLDSGGTDSGYVKINVFMKSGGFISYTSSKLTTYSRSDLKTSIGNTGTGDKIYILGNTSNAVQIAYPLTAGGYKVGWIPISSYKGTFAMNANGGSGSMSDFTVKYGDSFSIPKNKFTYTGHTFAGWNVYRTSDKKWVVSGGWKTEKEITSNNLQKMVYKEGWSGKFDKSWKDYSKTSENYTLYPIWNKNTLSIYINANGGTVDSDTYKLNNNIVCVKSDDSKYVQKWTYNSKKTNGLVNASTLGLSKKGHTFAGWGTSAGGGTIFDQKDADLVPTDINAGIKTGNCSTTLYAIWKPNTYNVIYKANAEDVSNMPSNQVKTYGKDMTLSDKIPERDGYVFEGWAVNTGAKVAYKANDKYTNNDSITLYAVWKYAEEVSEDASEDASEDNKELPSLNGDMPRIYLDNVNAAAGDQVTMCINMENNPGITALRMKLEYDESALTMTDFEFGDIVSVLNTSTSEKYKSGYSFSMYSGVTDYSENGVIAKVTFRINEDLEDGSYPVSLVYDQEDIFNLEGNDVKFKVDKGTVLTRKYKQGDLNQDGKINMKDVVLLQQIVNGWDISYNAALADFNLDNRLNMKDVVALSRYING